ncbi:MAG TPA: hydrogenase maturation nickel metallochaperone HypA [Candidatus Binataceae bacterium]|jgi:hydrogenase nickel incorporation protein HypA/HybF|nr:hydrogenase maturation nickel metallochaperone HypA [Candidatus Binataceae bacterium]
MHESSLAKKILDAALELAPDGMIVAVRGWIADTEAMDRASLALHFAAHARETRAETARLEMRIAQVAARCVQCGERYAPDHLMMLCPRCGSTEAQLLGRIGIGIDAIDVAAE